MRLLALLLLLVPFEGARAQSCTAGCRSSNTSCQQKCGESEESARAGCRADCVRNFYECRCGCGDSAYCETSDPQPGCKLLAQREATAPAGRRPASRSTRTSSAAAGRSTPKSRR